MQGNIIVAGYPKSGNTWLVRLIADALNSPAVGFWNCPANPEESIEGLGRPGKFAVYKSHHTASYFSENDKECPYVVTIVRDPRDVLLSMSDYFSPLIFYSTLKGLQGWRGSGILERLLRRNRHYHHEQVFRAMREGLAAPWLETPWDTYVNEWRNCRFSDLVRYEDLLMRPEEILTDLFKSWAIEFSQQNLAAACVRQSFSVRKAKMIAQGENAKSKFLKQGKSGKWQDNMSPKLAEELSSRFREVAKYFEYCS